MAYWCFDIRRLMSDIGQLAVFSNPTDN